MVIIIFICKATPKPLTWGETCISDASCGTGLQCCHSGRVDDCVEQFYNTCYCKKGYNLNNYDGYCYKAGSMPLPSPTPQPDQDWPMCRRKFGDKCYQAAAPWMGCSENGCGLNLRCWKPDGTPGFGCYCLDDCVHDKATGWCGPDDTHKCLPKSFKG